MQNSSFHVIVLQAVTLSWPPDGVFERGRIVSRTSKCTRNAPSLPDYGRNKTIILHFLKDPEIYGTKKKSNTYIGFFCKYFLEKLFNLNYVK